MKKKHIYMEVEREPVIPVKIREMEKMTINATKETDNGI